MKELGDSINSSLSESEQIAEAISRIKHAGYDVFLVLEATIGFNRHDSAPAESADSAILDSGRAPEFNVNAQDVRFLRSLRIALDDTPSDDHSDHKRAA